jgi:hypothetical protein
MIESIVDNSIYHSPPYIYIYREREREGGRSGAVTRDLPS